MINLTREVQVIKEGADLSNAVIQAIENAKECVMKEIFDGCWPWPLPEDISAGSKNPFRRASIIKFFDQHDDPTIAPEYNQEWIEKIYSASQTAPDAQELLSLIPKQANPKSLTNNTMRGLFKSDALLILHFLWFERAVLLPVTLPRPMTRDRETGGQALEYAANFYPETLALVRYPFLQNFRTKLVDFSEFLPETSHDNFNWYAWRFIRATDWHVVEDIDLEDVDYYLGRTADQKTTNIPNYPIAPKTILACFKEAFPNRCQFSMDDDRLKNKARLATESAIESGNFYVPKEAERQKESWLFYERKFLKSLKRKMNTWRSVEKNLGILNAYLFDELPSKVGYDSIPMPEEFTRKFIDVIDDIPNLIDFVQKNRKPTTVRAILLHINQFMTYLQSCSNTYKKLRNFQNPIYPNLDFPLLKGGGNSTSKAVFGPDHFVPLLQYCYAVEAFGWFLSEKILGFSGDGQGEIRKRKNLKNIINPSKQVFDTESVGFVPIVFVKNPEFDEKTPRSKKNRRMIAKPIFLLPKAVLPIFSRRLKNHVGLTSFPALNHIQQTIIMLETGIRNVHVRWLDRRTFDRDIDRSRPLPPICDLWVDTDKAHDGWPAKVSRSVIEVLDRQKQTHDWFDEPEIHEEAWYNNYDEQNTFGKFLTIFA